jgi:hypothetical protein
MMSNAIIAKLQKATGPDRELDNEIAALVLLPATGVLALWCRPDGGYIGAAPRFTASIDAALTFVPKVCAWRLTLQTDGTYYAIISRIGIVAAAVRMTDIYVEANGCINPAIAICICALKAREIDRTESSSREESNHEQL